MQYLLFGDGWGDGVQLCWQAPEKSVLVSAILDAQGLQEQEAVDQLALEKLCAMPSKRHQ